MNIKIENDVYFISQRLREIDKNYFLMYNTKTKKFEVHNENQTGSTFCLTLPFASLDARSLQRVLRTRIENCEKILADMEKENQILEKRQRNEVIENLENYIDRGKI